MFEEFTSTLPIAPAANTGQMWLLQIGLYELQRAKESADDWVWFVDHAVQMGTLRCLVVVGCRRSAWHAADRPLDHGDLSMFALEPVEKSDGTIVAQQLATLTERTGIVPRAVLCDQGWDLKNGIATYRQSHPETLVTHDIAHQAANEMKRELEADERWANFLVATGKAKQRLIMTPLAHLVPPKLRSKARYMNLDELVTWGENILGYLNAPHPVAGQTPSPQLLDDKLGWVHEYREAILEWGAAMRTVETTLTWIRRHGYYRRARRELAPQLFPAGSAMAHRVATRLLNFVASQSVHLGKHEHLPGSTECLESLIGKGKRLEGQHSQSGFTKMILGLAAAVVNPTVEYVRAALTAIKNHDVIQWHREHLGISLAAKRHAAFTPSNGTKAGQVPNAAPT